MSDREHAMRGIHDPHTFRQGIELDAQQALTRALASRDVAEQREVAIER